MIVINLLMVPLMPALEGALAWALSETGLRARPAVPVARESQLERTNESVGAGGRS